MKLNYFVAIVTYVCALSFSLSAQSDQCPPSLQAKGYTTCTYDKSKVIATDVEGKVTKFDPSKYDTEGPQSYSNLAQGKPEPVESISGEPVMAESSGFFSGLGTKIKSGFSSFADSISNLLSKTKVKE